MSKEDQPNKDDIKEAFCDWCNSRSDCDGCILWEKVFSVAESVPTLQDTDTCRHCKGMGYEPNWLYGSIRCAYC